MLFGIWVNGTPKGTPRGRATVRGGKPAIWTPGTAEAWKGEIARACEQCMPATPLAAPLELVADIFFPRPKRLMRKKDPDHPIAMASTPDFDNVAKAICDALQDIGVIADDRYIVHATINKWHTAKTGFGYRASTGFTGAAIRLSKSRGWGGPESGPWSPGGAFRSGRWPILSEGDDNG